MRYALAIAAISIAASAHAAPWKIDPAASMLTFRGHQASDAFTGRFTRFTPVVDFNPQAPEKGSIHVTVDMSSAIIDDKDKQESLPTSEWFDTATFPTATFTSTGIHALSSHNSYAAAGTLTIKGVSQPITLPFTLTEKDGLTFADGELVLQRQKFHIGTGQWKSDEWIAYPVTVTFHIQASQ